MTYPISDMHIHIQPWRQLKPAVADVMRVGKEAHWDRLIALMDDPKALLEVMDASGVWRVALINYPSPDLMGFDEKAVLAESFERIHRSNLAGMGVLPLQFMDDENAQSLGLTAEEVFSVTGLEDGTAKTARVAAERDGKRIEFEVKVLLLTPKEVEYFRHGGILHYVLRQLAAG